MIPTAIKPDVEQLNTAISDLSNAKDAWANTSNAERLIILTEVKDALMGISKKWVSAAARQKEIPVGSPLIGEEWMSGPYAVMAGCNALIDTISKMDDKKFLDGIPLRILPNGQSCATVIPHKIWDYLLFSGVKAEVWMQAGINAANLSENTAGGYDILAGKRTGKVAVVLGAGNITAITPLDCFQKLFHENQVVMLKMNPITDYLIEFFQIALKPLIDRNALRITAGSTEIGEYLCNHPDIEEIHITGSKTSHDNIVWGAGVLGRKNKAAGTPRNTRRITSELGGVGPTIVVPGPWTKADIQFQAEHIATQKLHNSGFNCIACQMLILPKSWAKIPDFLASLEPVTNNLPTRGIYYPGTKARLDAFEKNGVDVKEFKRKDAVPLFVAPVGNDNPWFEQTEVFGPALSTLMLNSSDSTETYLRDAIKYANDKLAGTLGANIIIHPATLRKIGKQKFEKIIAELRYGCIGVNAWTGLGFLAVQAPWSAFPGHTLGDVGSGIGVVHNSYMFDKSERTVIYAPFRPFPRNLLSGGMSLLPKPPWFVTHSRAAQLGKRLTEFQYKPRWSKIPGIFINALRG